MILMNGVIKISFLKFLKRQDEFDGKTVAFITKWKDGTMSRVQRISRKEDYFCMYSGEHFEILEVGVLN